MGRMERQHSLLCVRAGCGRAQSWVCCSCFLQCRPKSRSFSQKKAPSASPTCHSCTEQKLGERKDFPTRELSFPHPSSAVPLGFLSLAPSPGGFSLLGSGALLGDEALRGNVLTLLGFSGWDPRCRFPVLGAQPRWGFACDLTVKYFGIWGKQTNSWGSVPYTRLTQSWNCGFS